METAMKIRRRILVEGESIRSVNRTTGISRTTIRRYLENDKPPNYKTRQAGLRSILRGFEAGDAMQFDWSQEVVVLGGIEQKIKVAHFKLSYSRHPDQYPPLTVLPEANCQRYEQLLGGNR